MKIPEDMDIATALCAGVVRFMTSFCIDTLKVVDVNPQNTHNTMIANTLFETGKMRSMQVAKITIMQVVKKYLFFE